MARGRGTERARHDRRIATSRPAIDQAQQASEPQREEEGAQALREGPSQEGRGFRALAPRPEPRFGERWQPQFSRQKSTLHSFWMRLQREGEWMMYTRARDGPHGKDGSRKVAAAHK